MVALAKCVMSWAWAKCQTMISFMKRSAESWKGETGEDSDSALNCKCQYRLDYDEVVKHSVLSG